MGPSCPMWLHTNITLPTLTVRTMHCALGHLPWHLPFFKGNVMCAATPRPSVQAVKTPRRPGSFSFHFIGSSKHDDTAGHQAAFVSFRFVGQLRQTKVGRASLWISGRPFALYDNCHATGTAAAAAAETTTAAAWPAAQATSSCISTVRRDVWGCHQCMRSGEQHSEVYGLVQV